ncbi:hypothetical protein THAOC_13280 [Thalassiosira oceanica]|uniref:Uncharacterized protein n=1 Tax=Thalassiosira oceanica TaxID=159749 RepID=K0SKH4_THAOC|nr:hypothetical protein THAOC_13280 [Thalassiosira oceanica]|eukprot:EJK65820.1 hypothetical protein THAOC_13280 [Thalassiosira oceanica]
MPSTRSGGYSGGLDDKRDRRRPSGDLHTSIGSWFCVPSCDDYLESWSVESGSVESASVESPSIDSNDAQGFERRRSKAVLCAAVTAFAVVAVGTAVASAYSRSESGQGVFSYFGIGGDDVPDDEPDVPTYSPTYHPTYSPTSLAEEGGMPSSIAYLAEAEGFEEAIAYTIRGDEAEEVEEVIDLTKEVTAEISDNLYLSMNLDDLYQSMSMSPGEPEVVEAKREGAKLSNSKSSKSKSSKSKSSKDGGDRE